VVSAGMRDRVEERLHLGSMAETLIKRVLVSSNYRMEAIVRRTELSRGLGLFNHFECVIDLVFVLIVVICVLINLVLWH
jgi:hypothetical protein